MSLGVQKSMIIISVLLMLLLLISCKGRVAAGEEPRDTAAALKLVQTGTQGVEISLLNNYPPPQIYDQNELVAIVEVNNKGNYDLEREQCFIQITGFDPNIVLGGLNTPRSCSENICVLEGKNVYNGGGG